MGQLKVDEHKKMPGVFIGDPCYILPDDFYSEFWGETHKYEDGAFSTEEGRPVMIVAATAHGDGRYPGEFLNHLTSEGLGCDFIVDSGCLAIVNLEFADPKKIEEVRSFNSLGIIIDQPCTGMRLDESKGSFFIDVLIPAESEEKNASHYVYINTADCDNIEYEIDDAWDDWNEDNDWDDWDI